MPHPFVKFHHVSFAYDTATQALFKDLTLHLSSGWTGVVGSNGTGKTTLLKLATGQLEPSQGSVERPWQAVYCAQRTDVPPEQFDKFLGSLDKTANIIKGQLEIGEDWARRWETLSHGERKRAQIGVALWLEPNLLAIDEPTNHVDANARKLLKITLFLFKGVGLLVSHDRDWLDSLCTQCLFIDPPQVIIRKGGYTKGRQILAEEQTAVQKQRAIKKKVFKKLKREAGKRRDLANQADKKMSKKGIPKKDHAAKGKIDAARVTGKDGVGGKLLRQLDGRLSHAEKELERVKVKKDYAMGIWLSGALSNRNTLLDLPEGSIVMGNHKYLNFPKLLIKPDNRIGITGQNGAGKSTLLQYIISHLNVPSANITYVPQEIDLSRSREILNQAQELPSDQKGHLMTIVSRLGSRPQRLLESISPSPGETRKLLLAVGMTKDPHIVIMDEPTNHMDLPSIECLEGALSNCPCCLVLISHDETFLGKLTRQRWRISKKEKGAFSLNIS